MITTEPLRLAAQEKEYNSKQGVPKSAFDFCSLTTDEENNMDTTQPKAIAHSHTSLDTFKTCPRQYQAKYVTKEVKFKETVATIYGNRVHEELEMRVKNKTPLSAESAALESMVQAIESMTGVKEAERSLAIDHEYKPVQFFSPLTYLRGKADIMVHNEDEGSLFVGDYKTGKRKNDPAQMETLTVLAFHTIPGIKKVKTAFIYTKIGEIDDGRYEASDIPALVARIKLRTDRVEEAVKANTFIPTPNGLCREWCDVVKCQYHGKGKQR
jgi:hypothetical protein